MGEINPGPSSLFASFLADLGRALFGGISEVTLAKLDELRAQVLDLKEDTDAMHDRVLIGVANLRAQIQALKDQLINIDVPQEITDIISSVDETVNVIDPSKPDVPPPPPPEPTPA